MPFAMSYDAEDGILPITCVICTGTRLVGIYCLSCFRAQSKHPADCPKSYMHPCCLECFEMLTSRKERVDTMLDAAADASQAIVSE